METKVSGKTPGAASDDTDQAKPLAAGERWPVVLLLSQEGTAGIAILPEAPRAAAGVCRCGGCHATLHPDPAANFLPK